MNKLSTLISLLLLGLILPSCGGSKSVGVGYLQRIGLTPYDIDENIGRLNPEIVIQQNADGSVYLGFLCAAGGTTGSVNLATLSSLESASFVIFDKEGEIIDSVHTTDIVKSGLAGTGTASLAGSAGVDWIVPDGLNRTIRLVTLIRSGDRIWIKEVLAQLPERLPTDPVVIEIEPTVQEDGLKIVMTATRFREAGITEHLSTGERFRIEIFEGPLAIWSTADGQMFTQAEGPVQPEEVGESVRFEAYWNGNSKILNRRAENGRYTIVATIPARPVPYVLRTEIEWKSE